MNEELRLRNNMVHVEMENGKASTLLFLSPSTDEESAQAFDSIVENDGWLDLRLDFDIVDLAGAVIDLHSLYKYDEPTMQEADRPMIVDLCRQLQEAINLLSGVKFVQE